MKCKLGASRNKFVFGEGDPKAELMFIGGEPRRDEDLLGRPFVGEGGQLLEKMINAMQFKREKVYVANVLKCRPPEDRIPENNEVESCLPYLMHQIDLIRPKAIVLLGALPAKFLLGVKDMSEARGKWFDINGIKTMPTYHPDFLLRNLSAKKIVWADLQLVMTLLGKKTSNGD
jgi:DNA polymerase